MYIYNYIYSVRMYGTERIIKLTTFLFEVMFQPCNNALDLVRLLY